METERNDGAQINCLKVPSWSGYPGLIHGFFGRRGGRSRGPFAGLNVSMRVGDDPAVVTDNFCDMKRSAGIHSGRVIVMRQVHGDGIVEVRDASLKEAGEADGMISALPNVYLGVLTADCVPILLLAPRERVVAAVHAGWRGTLAGIAAKAVERLEQRFGVSPRAVEAALGPSIGACCYEVKEDVSRPLAERWGGVAERSTRVAEGRIFVDLRRINRGILEQCGVPPQRVHEIGPCTSCAAQDFFSFRRERRETGRQISLIGFQAD
ncbi:MAG TPA: peptidoglycan editing factor PgeF [candidate division Zixibacteria bacterium]|nr:peptidoglycan editing factor PgeF [candidate division Zixibacteria bacterium]